ncbi:sporulation protein YhaL [Scopulibacillus darangshiensis]|uniref:Sporulation protein YhaL n=1 Tax=Scopulibacillus darangshiensis TaxID=442528 RepID=A0A4R2P3L9_9BACL|nr:sporulation YhaL family protein [Scopulibacillus darangshiensis]TCP29282.1 sporulation protein YhaL [Scopulibacillus darangshiensis]
MKNTKRSLIIIALIMFVFILQQLHLLSGIISHLESLPWWMYLVFLGILISAYQFLTLSKEDKEVDQQWIEEQGEVFIKRMREEKKRRHPNNNEA